LPSSPAVWRGASGIARSSSAARCCGGAWFLLVPGVESAYVSHWLPGLIMSGMAVGLVLPTLSGAAVSKLPAAHYAVGSAVNQATRQIGAVIGVAITVLLLGQGAVQRSSFDAVYGLHIGLALLTAVLCLFVSTRPAARATHLSARQS
jgi:hypothetical protein